MLDIFERANKFLSENHPRYWSRRLLKEKELLDELSKIFPSYTYEDIPHIVNFGYKEEPKCALCGKIVKVRAEKINNTCSYSCSTKLSANSRIETARKTNIEKYGVDHPLKSSKVIEKRKQTNLQKYGVENVSNVDSIIEKRKQTNIERYGVTSNLIHYQTKEKIKKTNLERYGHEHPSSSDTIKEKIKKNNLKKYGVENISSLDEIKTKKKNNSLSKYGVEHIMQINMSSFAYNTLTDKILLSEYIKDKTPEKVCEELSISKTTLYVWIKKHQIEHEMKIGANISSSLEHMVCSFIEEINIGYEKNNRFVIPPKEIDIWVPEHNIGFEIHGLYWHGEAFKKENKTLHIDKHNMAIDNKIKLYQFFEDEIVNKFDIVKSMILSKLGKIENRIFARKTEIREIPWKAAKIFLENNHIQGQGKSGTYNIGLYYNNELVSIAVFGKLRPSLGSKNIKGHYELYRYCNKINTTVLGGFGKLFKYFINKYNPDKIISFSDKRLFSGDMYGNVGFIYDGDTSIGYWYVKGQKRYHRYNFTKGSLVKKGYNPNKTEWEIMQEIGYDRVWDCGNTRWVWNKE